MQNKIIHLNLSDNAFGPRGIPAFDFLLKAMSSLKTLKITNCGLGPEGGEMIAAALAENKDLRLAHFSAGRDRLENKGITAIAGVLGGQMAGALEVIEVPQNGIKKDGMMALLEALKANASSLREVYLHDNWIKQAAIDRLVEFVIKAERLERLNISDSTMGTDGALLLVKALQRNAALGKSLRYFACNYNEVESSKVSKRILDMFLADSFEVLETVEFRGNTIGRKHAQEYIAKFEAKGRKLIMFEDEDLDDEDADEEEDEDAEEGAEEDELLEKLEKLRL
jgi:Ran GTPase-activating protein 1